MTYATQKAKSGQEPVYIVELKLDKCTNTYGSAPCTASGPAGLKCFNTFGTCQDQANYTKGTKIIRFSSTRVDGIQAAGDPPTFPVVTGVSTAPTQLTPGKGLGVRSTCNVSLMDFPWTDVGLDPYLSDRTYNPQEQGSFFSKLQARERYMEGRKMTIKTGYLADDGTYDASNFIERVYFIDTISGPSANGAVTIKGKDILKFADSEKAQLPTQSQAVLDTDITAAATSFAITDPEDNVKAAYDAGQTYIRIDDEIMDITNLTGSGGAYTLMVTRGTLPSFYNGTNTADNHGEGATVQNCHLFEDEAIDDIVYYLLNTVAGIDASYLPTSDWADVIAFGLQSYLFSALLTEPEGVKKLLEEITQHTILLWYDERAQEVKMDSILNRTPTIEGLDDDDIKADSVSVTRDDKERVSQLWFAFGHRSPVLEMDELKHFSSVNVTADLTLEGENAYNLKKVKRVFSRWVPADLGAVASEITNRFVNYYKETKTSISLTLVPKDDDTWTGDIIDVATRQRQDQFGASRSYSYRVLTANEVLIPGAVSYKYVIQSTDRDAGRYALIGPNTLNDYDAESDANKLRYAFIAYSDRGDGEPGFPTTDEPYLIQ